jgi:DNA-binding CsgD family transcriptional regulator
MAHLAGDMTSPIGRDAELGALQGFFHEGGTGFAALVLEGEPGIGKTALWLEGLAAAEALGYRVLSSRTAPSEATFSFAGLGDLADEALEEVRAELPAPQLRAIDVALLRAPAGRRAPDRRAVATATLTLVRALARARPVLLAIDDVQWLDQASSSVLEFALRRLRSEPVRLLATRRSGGASDRDLASALPPEAVRRVEVGPLGAAALYQVLATVGSMPRPLFVRIQKASGGNPFFALEMARALAGRTAGTPPEDAMPVPESLGVLVRGRIAGLSPRDREVLVHVAAMARPGRPVLEGALPERLQAAAAVRRAVESGLLVADGDRLRFSHPLLGSVLYSDTPEPERRRVHHRLSSAVPDPEERAWHLALATVKPEEAVASALESAARQARSRGATDAAASLSRQSVRLTPSEFPGEAWRRTMLTADSLVLAGRGDEARRTLEDLAAVMPPGPARGEALWRLGRMRHEGYDFSPEHIELFRRALADASGDHRLRARILVALAWAELHEDSNAAADHASQAVRAAEEAGDLGALADSLASVGFLACLRGAAEEASAFDRALELEPHIEELYVDERPSWLRAVSLMFHDRFDEARSRIRSLVEEAVEGGEENALPSLRYRLSMLESWAGNWREAEDQAAQGYEGAVQTDQPVAAARLLSAAALVHGLQGQVERARQEALESLGRLEQRGQPASVLASPRSVLGFVALSEGDPQTTVANLARVREDLRRVGSCEPGTHRFAADLAESYLGLGAMGEAEDVVAELEEWGSRLDRAYALATAARCRALLQAAGGDLDAAITSVRVALAHHERLPQPFELGRTLLVAGQVQRRSRLKAEARASLDHALDIFDRLGSPPWSERARAELGRIGGRAAGPAALTPTEERVATLAAEGRTNREIADQLFMTVRTVEWNLSKVYRKLQVRSRTELARTVGGR